VQLYAEEYGLPSMSVKTTPKFEIRFRILVGGTVPFRSVPDFSNHPKWCALCSLEAATVARAMADGDGGSRSSIVRSLSSLWKSSEEKEESWGLVRKKGEITRL